MLSRLRFRVLQVSKTRSGASRFDDEIRGLVRYEQPAKQKVKGRDEGRVELVPVTSPEHDKGAPGKVRSEYTRAVHKSLPFSCWMLRLIAMVRLKLHLHSVVVVLFSALAFGQSNSVSTDIVAKAAKSVVLLKGVTDGGTVSGSGFLISTDGKIATNLHVIRDMKSCGVQLASGESYDKLTVLAFDDRKDLAILKIAGFDLPAIELGNSNEVRPGEPVIAIGNPDGLQGTVTGGMVSAVRDDPFSGGYKVIQTDAASNPGNSGGPLINSQGQVIGVITSKLRSSEGLNFAVPINYLRGLMASTDKPITLAELRTALSNAPADAFKTTEPFPSVWKSTTSGGRFLIRKEAEAVYIERVLTDAEKKVGIFQGAELHKSQDKYTGTGHSVAVQYYLQYGEYQANGRCTFDIPWEVSLLSTSRIEGRLFSRPTGSKIDFKKCTFDKNDKKAEWESFVWIPE